MQINTASLASLRQDNGQYRKYTDLGSYPIFYITMDDGILCPDCANGQNDSEAIRDDLDPTSPNDRQWIVADADVNWEDPDMWCDHCNARIESAYAEDRQKEG